MPLWFLFIPQENIRKLFLGKQKLFNIQICLMIEAKIAKYINIIFQPTTMSKHLVVIYHLILRSFQFIQI